MYRMQWYLEKENYKHRYRLIDGLESLDLDVRFKFVARRTSGEDDFSYKPLNFIWKEGW